MTHATGAAGEDSFSFTPFTRHPFFTQVNRWIIDKVIGPGRQIIVDLGCGPGAVTKLILERLSGAEPPPHVIGVDPSPSAIARARACISSRFAEFKEGTAELLSRLVPPADAVVFLNAIHLVQDKRQVLGEIRKALKPRGLLGFNSTFFNGAYVEGTGGFWRRWVVRAVQVLREQGIAVKHEGHAAAMQWLSAEEYAQACRDAGLRPTSVELVTVDMSAESLADIGRFSLFIEGALPGVPLQEGSDALQIGLERTMDELKVELAGGCSRSGLSPAQIVTASTSSAPTVITFRDSSTARRCPPMSSGAVSVRQTKDAHHANHGSRAFLPRMTRHTSQYPASNVTKCAFHASGDTSVIRHNPTATSLNTEGSASPGGLRRNANARAMSTTATTP